MKSMYGDAYAVLSRIFREGAYLNIELQKFPSPATRSTVYGVLENYFRINHIIDGLCPRGIKNSHRAALNIGAYFLLCRGIPANAVIAETNALLDELGKSGIKKFAAGILYKISRKEYAEIPETDPRSEEIKYNMSAEIIDIIKADYPNDYGKILSAGSNKKIHVRPKFGTSPNLGEPTFTGYFTEPGKDIGELFKSGAVTYQSYPSTLVGECVARKFGLTSDLRKSDFGVPKTAVEAAKLANSKIKILDCCAAPGGKAVYLAERGFDVSARDVYPHRLKLIESYAARSGVKMDIRREDATKFNAENELKFDVVLADVPCSGLGVISRRKDEILRRTAADVENLAILQRKILGNVVKYVKPGGLLVYSTCTVTKRENIENINDFSKNHPECRMEKLPLPYENEGYLQFLPDGEGAEGFFICCLRKNR